MAAIMEFIDPLCPAPSRPKIFPPHKGGKEKKKNGEEKKRENNTTTTSNGFHVYTFVIFFALVCVCVGAVRYLYL